MRFRSINLVQVAAIFLAVVLMGATCRSRRSKTTPTVFLEEKNGKDSLLRQKWEYFSARIGADYESGEMNQSVSVNLRMRRDSLIWFGVNVLGGLQVAKGIVTKDSIFILFPLQSTYRKSSIADLAQTFGVDLGLHELQNIFIGNPVMDSMVYRKDSLNKFWFASNPPLNHSVWSLDFQLPDSARLVQRGTVNELQYFYRETLTAGKMTIAKWLEFIAIGASNTVRLKLEFKTASDEFIPSYPFSIPDSYKQEGAD